MNQKEEEKLIIQKFRNSFREFPKGKLISAESPDFVLRISPKKRIGIELIQLYYSEELIAGIHTAIKKKEAKLPLYRSMNLSELWLLIHSDDAFSGLNFNFDNKLNNLNVLSSFHRIFLFDLFSGKIYSFH